MVDFEGKQITSLSVARSTQTFQLTSRSSRSITPTKRREKRWEKSPAHLWRSTCVPSIVRRPLSGFSNPLRESQAYSGATSPPPPPKPCLQTHITKPPRVCSTSRNRNERKLTVGWFAGNAILGSRVWCYVFNQDVFFRIASVHGAQINSMTLMGGKELISCKYLLCVWFCSSVS